LILFALTYDLDTSFGGFAAESSVFCPIPRSWPLIPSPLFLNSFNYSNAAFIAISLGELPPLLAPPPSFGIAYLRKKK
jgi:hypothetical protein